MMAKNVRLSRMAAETRSLVIEHHRRVRIVVNPQFQSTAESLNEEMIAEAERIEHEAPQLRTQEVLDAREALSDLTQMVEAERELLDEAALSKSTLQKMIFEHLMELKRPRNRSA